MLKNLKLKRPIAFIDVETTGISTNSDRIVELSILRIQPDGKEEYKSHRVNPGMPATGRFIGSIARTGRVPSGR